MTHKKQGTSSSEANPLDLAQILANDEQPKVFTEHFLGSPIFAPKYGNISNFELDDFHFPTLLRQQNLFAFCEESNAYYPELVREFYYNLNLMKNRLTSSAKGKEIILDINIFSSICCNIPYHGSIKYFGLTCDWDNYVRKEFYYSMCRFSKVETDLHKQMALGETVKNRDILAVGNLNLEDRLLHYFLSYVIIPKYSNHSQINDMKLQLMDALKHNLDINWALTIMNHMWSVRETISRLPYAIIISNILEQFGVSTASESKITLNARDSKIDVDVIHNMSFFQDLTDRVYKHRSDKLAVPINLTANLFVNPPAPQPSTFQSESSSFAQIPSNQMIMDELFSLRGYISNRMDALDAQNQQVQIDLQRLSYKINMMDLDEESSEPESYNICCLGFYLAFLDFVIVLCGFSSCLSFDFHV
ncbi:hypothetical protein Lal_00011406 [Lupinus albus]|nr:hypothetical protein Lal_00011406 [Lupinus albus]